MSELTGAQWRFEVPTQPGWYWFAEGPTVPWAGKDGFFYEVLYVFFHEDVHALVAVQGERCRHGTRTSWPLELFQGCGYWWGPLQAPDPSPEMVQDNGVPGRPRTGQLKEL